MANTSVTAKRTIAGGDNANSTTECRLTRQVEFDHIPVQRKNMMAVLPGVDAFYARSTAGALEAAVQSMLTEGVQEGMDGEMAYLCAFALDAARALRDAAGCDS